MRPRARTLMQTRRGFTLAETLLALGLILLLMGALYTFSAQVASSRKHVETDSSKQRALTDVLDAIERAGLTSVAGDATLGAGVSGNSKSLTIVSRAGGELVREQWKFDRPTGSLQVSRTPIRLGDNPNPETPVTETWATGLEDVRFRFLVANAPAPAGGAASIGAGSASAPSWRESFDSLAQGQLPRAIEVQAWFVLGAGSASSGTSSASAASGQTDSSDASSSSATDRTEPVPRAVDRRRLIVIDAPMPIAPASSSSPAGASRP